jgi:DNA-binding transcriptional ArsR family regulator
MMATSKTSKRRTAEQAATLAALHHKAALFAALADPNRLALLTTVIDQPGITNAEVVAAHTLAQSTVTYHLLRLTAAGLVVQDKQRSFVHHTATELAVQLMAVQP